MAKKRFYAVTVGRKPGIYQEWYGPDGAEVQVNGFPGAQYKGFTLLSDAQNWLQIMASSDGKQKTRNSRALSGPGHNNNLPAITPEKSLAQPKISTGEINPTQSSPNESKVVIYADGSSIGNPGPGGYGTIILDRDKRSEYSGGYRLTTNNRMELMACIIGLQNLNQLSLVILYSDSRYVVNGMSAGWAKRWMENDWRLKPEAFAKNVDLWIQLLDLCNKHQVEFRWVEGHAGDTQNELCDQLAYQAAQQTDLLIDDGYELMSN